MESDDLDRLGRVLLGIGGCLTVVVFPVVILGFVLFGIVFAIGFGASPTSTEVNGLIGGAVVVLGVIAIAVGIVWVLALRAQRWALVVMVVVGLILTLLASPFPQRLGPDFQRPEDIEFTLLQLAVALMPAALAIGALLRLVARRRRRQDAARGQRDGVLPGDGA